MSIGPWYVCGEDLAPGATGPFESILDAARHVEFMEKRGDADLCYHNNVRIVPWDMLEDKYKINLVTPEKDRALGVTQLLMSPTGVPSFMVNFIGWSEDHNDSDGPDEFATFVSPQGKGEVQMSGPSMKAVTRAYFKKFLMCRDDLADFLLDMLNELPFDTSVEVAGMVFHRLCCNLEPSGEWCSAYTPTEEHELVYEHEYEGLEGAKVVHEKFKNGEYKTSFLISNVPTL